MEQEARAETENRQETCASCRYHEDGTCICMNWESPKAMQFVYREETCDRWKAKKSTGTPC